MSATTGSRSTHRMSGRGPVIVGVVGGMAIICLALNLEGLGAARPYSPGHAHLAIHRRSSHGGSIAVRKAADAASSTMDEWCGIYLGKNHIGYVEILSSPAHYAGHPAIKQEFQMVMDVRLLGRQMREDVDMTQVASKTGEPLMTRMLNSSGGHRNLVHAVFRPHAVICYLDDGSRRATRVVPIPAGVRLVSEDDLGVWHSMAKRRSGWTEYYFNPLTLSIDKFTGMISARSTGKGGYQMQGQASGMQMSASVDSTGQMTQMSLPMGIRMKREPRAVARLGDDYRPTADLGQAMAVASDQAIPDASKVSLMDVQVSGAPPDLRIPSCGGQVARHIGKGVWQIAITTTPEPPNPLAIPMHAPGGDLANTPSLTAANPDIQSQARATIGDERNSCKVIGLLRDWVNRHMRARYDIGVPRSGIDILRDPVGVCRDYAVLYASLARAVGIPTRVCAGLVYWRGSFYYHAWAESYAGRWIRVDPTMTNVVANATHIALACGDASAMYRAGTAAGSLRIHVMKLKD